MSVIVTLIGAGDAEALERHAAENAETMRGIVDHAVEHGLIAHRFYGSQDGQILVVDEWPDAESFQEFFAHMRQHIEPIMAAAGMTEAPTVRFWRKLDTQDSYGWE
jgi:hypothetical protein